MRRPFYAFYGLQVMKERLVSSPLAGQIHSVLASGPNNASNVHKSAAMIVVARVPDLAKKNGKVAIYSTP